MKHFNTLSPKKFTGIAFSIGAMMIILTQSHAIAARCNADFKSEHKKNNPALFYFSAKQHANSSTSFAWNFGDNKTDSIASPSHLYVNPGTYYVCLTVTTRNAAGDTLCSSSRCDSVHATAASTPSCSTHFKTEQDKGSLDVKFKVKIKPAGRTYSWNFGDGNISVTTAKNTHHIYAAAGSYNVCLTVTDSSGGIIHCQSTTCDSVHIVSPPSPSCDAGFTAKVSRTSFNVDVKGSSNPGSTTYSWNFGDGTIVSSGNKNNSHTYAAAGNYNVCLTVTDSAAGIIYCTASWCDSVHILAPPSPACDANFTAKQDHASLNIDVKGSHNPSGTTYSWNFGDGTIISSGNKDNSHTYAAAGDYKVCLTVTDSAAGIIYCTANWCDSVHIVPPPPICNADFNSHHGGNSLKEEFHSKGNPHGTVYAWVFGDGDSSSLSDPKHTYLSAAGYKVCLTVTVYDTAHNVICTAAYCDSVHAGSLIYDINYDNRASNGVGNLPNATIYPNPMTENTVLHIENTVGAVTMSIFENTGRLIMQKNNLVNGDFNLNKSQLSSGFYLYKISDSENNLISGKIVVQ